MSEQVCELVGLGQAMLLSRELGMASFQQCRRSQCADGAAQDEAMAGRSTAWARMCPMGVGSVKSEESTPSSAQETVFSRGPLSQLHEPLLRHHLGAVHLGVESRGSVALTAEWPPADLRYAPRTLGRVIVWPVLERMAKSPENWPAPSYLLPRDAGRRRH